MSDGLDHVTDGYFSGSVGGIDFIMAYFTVSYETTSPNITEIAPVPLPASLPLLGVGLVAMSFAARRKPDRAA